MEKLQITKGEWQIENKSANGIVQREDAIAITVNDNFTWDVCCIWNDIEQGMAEANAMLIIDAANTYQKFETLPSELLRQNREMREALKKLIPNMQGYAYEYHKNHRWFEFHFKDEIELLKTITSCNKGKE